jgi:hypothetical protein
MLTSSMREAYHRGPMLLIGCKRDRSPRRLDRLPQPETAIAEPALPTAEASAGSSYLCDGGPAATFSFLHGWMTLRIMDIVFRTKRALLAASGRGARGRKERQNSRSSCPTARTQLSSTFAKTGRRAASTIATGAPPFQPVSDAANCLHSAIETRETPEKSQEDAWGEAICRGSWAPSRLAFVG